MALLGKSWFDWADAVATPIVVVGIAGIFTVISLRAGRRTQDERALQLDRAREETLRFYLDRIAELVLDKGLIDSDNDSPVRAIALARTHNALTRLDGPRKGLLIKFLKESQLIRNGQAVISLALADLTNSDLSGANLRDCDFSGANLHDADFYNADFHGCDFENCVLTNQQLARCTDLAGAVLPNGDVATEETLQQLQAEYE